MSFRVMRIFLYGHSVVGTDITLEDRSCLSSELAGTGESVCDDIGNGSHVQGGECWEHIQRIRDANRP